MKRIYRSQEDRIIAGVCGGFAEYLGIDPTIVRLVWIFFTIFGGLVLTGVEVTLFLVCWRLLRIGFGIVNVWIWVVRKKIKYPNKNKEYYKKIFTDLTQANCHDKAKAARIMKKLI